VDDAPVRIIGVLPRDFELPTLEQADLLVPQALRVAHYTQGESGRPLRVFGRLKDGMTPERAAAMLQPLFQLAMEFAAPAQRKQVSVALHSVPAGCGLAWAMLRALRSIAPASIPRISQATLDGRVLLFTLAATVFCGLALGVPPAFSSMKLETLAGWRAAALTRRGWRRGLASAQIAVSLVLLSNAGLLLESLWRISRIDPGVNTEQVVTADITVGPPRYATPARRALFFENLMDRLRANPLVTAAALSDTVPPAGSQSSVRRATCGGTAADGKRRGRRSVAADGFSGLFRGDGNSH
jgi:hypothetical protein